jgi:hypothetical protein
MKANRDEPLEEIWAIRRRIARKFNYDPKRQAAHYQQKQEQLGAKIYRPEVPTSSDVEAFNALRDQARAEAATGQTATVTSYLAGRKRRAKRAK